MDGVDTRKKIPTNELLSVFSHAIGICRILAKVAEESGRFGIESFDEIRQELDRLNRSLEKIAPGASVLPPTIHRSAEAIASIINDALCNKSYFDVCMGLYQSKLAEHGHVGWREVLRLTQEPTISWGEPPQPTQGVEIESHEQAAKAKEPANVKNPPGPKISEDEQKPPKRSTVKGEARDKIIAGLTKHHEYSDGSCLNTDPIQVGGFANSIGVSKASVSDFLKKEFGKPGYQTYRIACNDASKLGHALKIINGELTPRILFNPLGASDGNLADE